MEKLSGTQIYQRIRHVADIRKKSIVEVTRDAGFKSPNTIYNYKYNAVPSSISLNAIAKALGTSVEFLRGETDDWHLPSETTELEDVKAKDEAEAKVLTMFRKSTEGMDEDEKLRFQESLDKLMNVAKDLNNPKK